MLVWSCNVSRYCVVSIFPADTNVDTRVRAYMTHIGPSTPVNLHNVPRRERSLTHTSDPGNSCCLAYRLPSAISSCTKYPVPRIMFLSDAFGIREEATQLARCSSPLSKNPPTLRGLCIASIVSIVSKKHFYSRFASPMGIPCRSNSPSAR